MAVVLLIPTTVFAQEESLAEIAKRLDAENLEKSKQSGSIIQPTPNTQQQSLQKIDCPKGTYQGLDNQRNPACRDINTNQIVDPNTGLTYDSQTGEIILDDEQTIYVGIGIFVVIVIVAVIAKASTSNSSSDSYKDVERKHFTPKTKESVKELQHGKCADCGKYPTHWEFDHIDSRGDNSIDNCQGLCKDCHQDKTFKDNERHRDYQDE
jgi:hypothetical protein